MFNGKGGSSMCIFVVKVIVRVGSHIVRALGVARAYNRQSKHIIYAFES